MKLRNAARTAATAVIAWMIAAAPGAQAVTVSDPVGDTFNSGTVDLVAVNVTRGSEFASFELVFADRIEDMLRNIGDMLGVIDLDTDRNPATGGTAFFGGDLAGGNSFINSLIAPNATLIEVPGSLVALGSEFMLTLWIGFDGPFDVVVVDANDLSIDGYMQVAVVSERSLAFDLPYAFIGGGDGRFNFSVIVGDPDAPTDRSPDGVFPSSTDIHEPSVAVLLTASMTAFLGLHGRRRRTRLGA